MVSIPEGGFALSGTFWPGNDFLLMVVNNEGNLDWYERYDVAHRQRLDNCWSIARLRQGDFVLVGFEWVNLGFGNITTRPEVLRVRSNGNERWHAVYDFPGEEGYARDGHGVNSVVTDHQNSIVAAGTANFTEDGTGLNGLVIKFEPEILEPQFIHWSPEDTMLTILQNDTIEFTVRAFDRQDDEMNYLWIMGEDTLSRDTITTKVFEELGEFEVQCQVSDGELMVAITWHVNVVEFYICSFTPDSLDLIIRRGTNVDFSLDVAALEDIELNYLWTHLDRNGRRHEIGEADSVNMLFDLMGNQRMEGFVWHGERSDEVLWNIDVRSVIWFYLPDITSLTVPVDTTIEFAVTPFNDNSDSLSYYWMLNEDTLEIDVRIASISFPDTGLQEVVSYVWDGGEMDSIMWEITVIPPVSAPESNVELLPMEPMLYPPSPNPFNSSVSLSFYLPRDEYVTLSVFDLNGRKVSSLVNSRQIVGGYTFTWNAAYPSAGMYLVVWQAGNVRRVEKLVLVK